VRLPPHVRRRTLTAIRPNAGAAQLYAGQLQQLVDEMHNSLDYWLMAQLKKAPRVILPLAQDESWGAALKRRFKELTDRWVDRFEAAAPRLAEYYAQKAERRITGNLDKILADAGMTVRFKVTQPVRVAMQASVGEQVSLIKSIAAEHLADVEQTVLRGVSVGRDLETISRDLQDRYDVTRDRAALIARDQTNKMSAVITRVRQREAGITQAIWVHSTAGKKPRPEHVAYANGRHATGGPVYDVSRGAYLEGVWTWPGHEVNCRCYSRPVLPDV
jgi:uncharacterized protein with gpF-like domain